MSVSRRKFLVKGTLLSAFPAVSNLIKSDLNPALSNELYLALSGHFKSSSYMGVGILQGNNQLSNDIRDLRINYNYRSQIRYKSSDEYKVPFCKELISYMDFGSAFNLRISLPTILLMLMVSTRSSFRI